MSEEKPPKCVEPLEPREPMELREPRECVKTVEPREPKAAPEKTSDYYRVNEKLPVRFNHPEWFRGYRTKDQASMYRTSNQTYGSRAPTVHEMPKAFYPYSSKFSRQLSAAGMFQSNTLNVGVERSLVTGPDNLITHIDRLNFHPSYNVNKPSICD